MKKQSINNETATDGYTVLADAIFRPILFSTPMVQAILEGRKTQTRRVIKDETLQLNKNEFEEEEFILATLNNRINKGDILWVRETFAKMFEIHEELVGKDQEDMGNWYKTDGELSEAPFYIEGYKWKPSIFMPKEACRIFLEVTNVRVQRLQDISESDAKCEGAKKGILREGSNTQKGEFHLELNNHSDYKSGFQFIWQSINGKESWNKNPWVWVYEFKRIERPSGFC